MEKKTKQKKVREGKIHLSTFLITVNSQVDDKKFIKRLKKAYDEFYDKVNDYIKDKSTGVKIKTISSEATVEHGERRKAYHIHALLRIEHTGKIHLDLDKMRSHFNTEVKGDGKCHLDVKFVSDPTFTIKEYFNKSKGDK